MNFLYQYDEAFYRYINRGSLDSAAVVVPLLVNALGQTPTSVLDLGCGAGAWLTVWKNHGAKICGIDGEYLEAASLLIAENEFHAGDVAAPVQLDQHFDLAQCLEVAEHIATEAGAQLIANLCNHADMVLFSAAPPGQGGENHQNEQPYGYWRDLFLAQGFQLYDPLRGELVGNRAVMPWYRYNTFLYLRAEAKPDLHQRLADFLVEPEQEPIDIAPAIYRFRRRMLALLPLSIISAIAVLKKSLAIRFQGQTQS